MGDEAAGHGPPGRLIFTSDDLAPDLGRKVWMRRWRDVYAETLADGPTVYGSDWGQVHILSKSRPARH